MKVSLDDISGLSRTLRLDSDRDPLLTGDGNLAKAARSFPSSKGFTHIGSRNFPYIVEAFILIMSCLTDGINRTSTYAIPASSLGIPQTPLLMVGVIMWCPWQIDTSNDRAKPHSLPAFGDKAITQPEGAEPCNVSRVTL